MNDDNTRPTSLEQLPTEIFLQIFAFLHLQEFIAAFSGLDSNIDSIITSTININHIVKYDDANAINLLHLFANRIHGIAAQFNSIRPEHFPQLGILHIYIGYRHSVNEYAKEVKDLFQIIVSNGFPQLRLCTVVGIAPLTANDKWLPSPALRSLHLDMKTTNDYEQLIHICPNLCRFTSYGDYPFKMPIVVFLDPIHHPKVDQYGRQCSCWDVDLWDMWSPANSLTDLVMSAIRLIDSDPGDHNCCNYEWTQQYHHNREIFYKTALLLTLSYGRPRY